MVRHDFLHIGSHERISTVRHSLFDWTLREWVLSSHDCKLMYSQAARVMLTAYSILLAAGTQKKNEASVLACSTARQLWQACLVAIFKRVLTAVLMESPVSKDGSGCSLYVESSLSPSLSSGKTVLSHVLANQLTSFRYFFIPDFPETTRAFYITAEEAEQQCKRLIAEGQKPLGHNPWTRTKFFSIAKQWQFWVLPLGYFFIQGSFANDQPVFALWLKSNGHSIYERNVWPTGQVAVGVVVQLLAGMLCDSPLLKGRRWPAIVVMQGVSLFGLVVLAIWDVPDSLKYVAYFVTYFSAGVPGPWYAWYSDLIPHDHEMRGFVIAASNMFSYIMSIWYSLAVWRTIDAPRFQAGFTAASVLGAAIITLAFIVRLLQRKDDRRRAQEDETSRDIETPAASQEKLDENHREKNLARQSDI
jgi:hypothetical protein